ncbi:MAG: hypothetical protein COW84_07095 [Gammaproteobacteria bacterium CG22_combo_CG10-13_8_21_14_all_40_8]|nr:MAG: hypothetical protein COW84_07095 [Gammaproteobacteria bacterium CG22_combo_CG10-13_8_21_14_all_40_8]
MLLMMGIGFSAREAKPLEKEFSLKVVLSPRKYTNLQIFSDGKHIAFLSGSEKNEVKLIF